MRIGAAASRSSSAWPNQPSWTLTSPSISRPEASRKSPLQRVLGKDAAQHLVAAPAHGGNGGDAEALVDLGPSRVVDPGDDVRDVVGFPGDAGGQDVRVVAAGHRGEGIGLGDVRTLEGVPVEADARDLGPGKVAAKPAEGRVVLVDDRHRMPRIIQGVGQRDPDPAATHNDKMRHAPDPAFSLGGTPTNLRLPVGLAPGRGR